MSAGRQMGPIAVVAELTKVPFRTELSPATLLGGSRSAFPLACYQTHRSRLCVGVSLHSLYAL